MNENKFNYSLGSENADQIINDITETIGLGSNEESALMTSNLADNIFNHTKQICGRAVQLKELMMMYSCAIKEVRTKFDVLNTEFSVRYQRNPIQAISTRLKQMTGITEKLEKKGLELTVKNIEDNIFDVAGIRVICSYIDDIYFLADSLVSQDDITLIKCKDYIKAPKPNGYRSLHLIVSVPVFFAEQKKEMKVEVQIRTIAMDYWASLEHQLKYKRDIANQKEIAARLKSCADVISQTDLEILDIRKQIELESDIPTDEKN